MSLIDDIKRDREAGTPPDWYISGTGHLCGGKDSADCRVIIDERIWSKNLRDQADARRIARVPELEQAYLDLREKADALAKEVDRVCSVLRDDNGHAPVSLELALEAYREAAA